MDIAVQIEIKALEKMIVHLYNVCFPGSYKCTSQWRNYNDFLLRKKYSDLTPNQSYIENNLRSKHFFASF